MAVRTSAGTGVIVSLVVFVLTTVFMLVLSIVFYVGKTDALEVKAKAVDELEAYATQAERSSDRFQGIRQASGSRSVVTHLLKQHQDLLGYVNGETSVDLEGLKSDLANLGVDEEAGIVRHTLEQQRRDIRNLGTEIDGFKAKLESRDEEIAERDAQIAQMKRNHEESLAEVSRNVISYGEAANDLRDDVKVTIERMELSVDELRDEYEDQIAGLEDEIDARGQELVLLRERVTEYERILSEWKQRIANPAMLVDARVIDVEPADGIVYISRGRQDRIVLGMTFEVYDDDASIRVDPRTRALPRGKASVQVVRVSPTTSTCKITRSVRGRPVTRDDVLANAIYDPEYKFKFLVHGKFDVDGDGRPSESEAQHLRSLVIDWGGQIVLGQDLPGDLDFLVLGQMPPMPMPLRPDATPQQIDISVRQRTARLKYESLFKQASEAQIPVLNANRFFILIGKTDR